MACRGIKSRLMNEQSRPLDNPVNSTDSSRQAKVPPGSSQQPAMFSSKPPEGSRMPIAAWGVAGLVVLGLIVGLVFATRHKSQAPPNTVQPLAAYAAEL